MIFMFLQVEAKYAPCFDPAIFYRVGGERAGGLKSKDIVIF